MTDRLSIEQQITAIQIEQVKLARQMKENAEAKMKLELTLLTMAD